MECSAIVRECVGASRSGAPTLQTQSRSECVHSDASETSALHSRRTRGASALHTRRTRGASALHFQDALAERLRYTTRASRARRYTLRQARRPPSARLSVEEEERESAIAR